ncbi:MAG TPA: hypothetical protein VMH80_27255 [Bryobacteraceae bacterium]|nr:hypothetical protein [Bryobacteraceae bacterium]
MTFEAGSAMAPAAMTMLLRGRPEEGFAQEIANHHHGYRAHQENRDQRHFDAVEWHDEFDFTDGWKGKE